MEERKMREEREGRLYTTGKELCGREKYKVGGVHWTNVNKLQTNKHYGAGQD